MADERIGNLAGRVRPADVGVPVVHSGDPPAEGGFQGLTGSLRFG
jgi:hypothetical protein